VHGSLPRGSPNTRNAVDSYLSVTAVAQNQQSAIVTPASASTACNESAFRRSRACAPRHPHRTARARASRLFSPRFNIHIQDRPLAIRQHDVKADFQMVQLAWQVAAFLVGLALWCPQWRRARRNSFILTVALAAHPRVRGQSPDRVAGLA